MCATNVNIQEEVQNRVTTHNSIQLTTQGTAARGNAGLNFGTGTFDGTFAGLSRKFADAFPENAYYAQTSTQPVRAADRRPTVRAELSVMHLQFASPLGEGQSCTCGDTFAHWHCQRIVIYLFLSHNMCRVERT